MASFALVFEDTKGGPRDLAKGLGRSRSACCWSSDPRLLGTARTGCRARVQGKTLGPIPPLLWPGAWPGHTWGPPGGRGGRAEGWPSWAVMFRGGFNGTGTVTLLQRSPEWLRSERGSPGLPQHGGTAQHQLHYPVPSGAAAPAPADPDVLAWGPTLPAGPRLSRDSSPGTSILSSAPPAPH